jgi:capsular exopolysaccharide synthesis family protein
MGRVDEALRRAAEANAGEQDRAGGASGVSDPAFPTETPPADDPAAADLGPVASPEENVSAQPGGVFARRADAGQHPHTEADPKKDGPRLQFSTKLVGDERMLTTSREQYRRLAATLHRIQATSGLRVVMIGSAVAGEGKTLTAANLALTFSESYDKDVLLIDGDLRRPSLARTFGIPGSPGLSDFLLRGHEGKLPLQRVSHRLSVLPGGRASADPMAGLTSERMQQLIGEARDAFDWVIVDTPPIGLMTDASLLAAMADGTVFVVKANATPYQIVERSIQALGNGQLLGVVLNRATMLGRGHKYYDYYHYAPGQVAETAE